MAELKKQINKIPDVYSGATFNEIKRDLISWLKNQDEFKDYDFMGSRVNVLTDLLSYVTLYIQQFANTALFESWIKTAALRSSVVQSAQDKGYIPDSRRSALDTIKITASHPLNPTSIKIPRGTKFVGVVKNTDSYPFVASDDVVIVRNTDNKYESLIKLVQGRVVRVETRFDGSPIIIRDKNIDRTQIKLFVDNAEWADYTYKSIVNTSGASNVFYMHETVDNETEIYFGEGENEVNVAGGVMVANYVGGMRPAINSRIVIEYISTSGESANGATDYVYIDTLENIKIEEIVVNPTDDKDYIGADGGGEPENIERIRDLAPVMRETQRRCVTASDYEVFVSNRFGSIVQAVQCFTDVDKPGYAFVSIKPKNGLRLTTVQKEDIKNYLNDYNVATITPAILDPNYLFIRQDIKVTYNINTLAESEEWLKGSITESIDKYYKDNVEIFNKSFSKSKMLTYVDDSDISIIGSSANIKLIREIENYYTTPMIGISFLNPVSSVKSSGFKFIPSVVEDEDEDNSYEVFYLSTHKTNNEASKLLIGPFKHGDIGIEPYTGNDFDKIVYEDRELYYEVGVADYTNDYFSFDLNKLGVKSSNFSSAYIEFIGTPVDDNIFTKDGSLIVFENDLRPQYTNIILEAITK
ncbi:baseplate wedge protein [Morganella phage vB_Mm5]